MSWCCETGPLRLGKWALSLHSGRRKNGWVQEGIRRDRAKRMCKNEDEENGEEDENVMVMRERGKSMG